MTTLVMAMNPERADDVCSTATRTLLEDRFDVRWGSDDFGVDELKQLLPGSEVVITSWGTPTLTAEMLAATDAPKVVAHAAGTIKNVLEPAALGLDLAVFSAGVRIAGSVAEYCLAATLTMLRRLPEFGHSMQAGIWKPEMVRGRELSGKTVGIVGASSTARAFIALLKAFHCDVVVYDPFLSEEGAGQLGVRRGTLEEVAQSPILSLHVPKLAETEGLITADHLRSMPDGGLLVNSATGAALDYSALAAELKSGRLYAALDVYPPSPFELPDIYRKSPNVLLTPHIAGDTAEGHQDLVKFVIDDVIAWLDMGRRGLGHVDLSALSRLA